MIIDGQQVGNSIFGSFMGNAGEQIRSNRAAVALMNRGFYHYLLSEFETRAAAEC